MIGAKCLVTTVELVKVTSDFMINNIKNWLFCFLCKQAKKGVCVRCILLMALVSMIGFLYHVSILMLSYKSRGKGLGISCSQLDPQCIT